MRRDHSYSERKPVHCRKTVGLSKSRATTGRQPQPILRQPPCAGSGSLLLGASVLSAPGSAAALLSKFTKGAEQSDAGRGCDERQHQRLLLRL